jgi:hypothetical protein
MNNISFDDLSRRFLSGITDIQRSSETERRQLLCPIGGRIPIVPHGTGAFCRTTWDSLEALSDFGRKWRSECPERKRRLESRKAPDFILGVIGDVLATKQLDKLDELDIKAFSKELRQSLTDRLAVTNVDLEYSFPCHLFDDINTGPSNIGPVRFMPRLDWLDHVEENNGENERWANLVRDNWQSDAATTVGTVVDKRRAEDVVTGFRDRYWIATVTVTTSELGRSDEWASILVRLAIDALGAPMSLLRATRLTVHGNDLDSTGCIAVIQSADGKTGIWFRGPGLRIGDDENAAQDFLQATSHYREAAERSCGPASSLV